MSAKSRGFPSVGQRERERENLAETSYFWTLAIFQAEFGRSLVLLRPHLCRDDVESPAPRRLAREDRDVLASGPVFALYPLLNFHETKNLHLVIFVVEPPPNLLHTFAGFDLAQANVWSGWFCCFV